MSGGYQQQVYNQPAQGIAGDRASQNPIASYDAGPGGLVAGPGGVTVGRFAWVVSPTDPNGTGQIANSFGSGNVSGLCYNDTQALNTQFLSDGSMVIPEGLPLALMIQGDWWVVNDGATEALVGMKAYADFATGKVSFAASGSPQTAATATGSTIAAETFSVTASINNDIMTVTAVGSGTVVNGAPISGTGIPSGVSVAQQLTGTPGGIGTYLLNQSLQKSVASETVTGSYGLFTVGTVTVGTSFAVGQSLATTSGVAAGSVLTQLLSGTGDAGSTFAVNLTQTVGSNSISSVGNVETKWQAASSAVPGGIVKITSWVGSQG